jgi:hypothetical protein
MQNSAPSTIYWCQCDIRIDLGHSNAWNIRRLVNVLFAPATQCTEVRFASFFSGEFITATVVNPPERRLAKRTSMQGITLKIV